MKKFLKKYYPEILSIFIPICIMLITCLFNDSFPFGKFTLVRYDGFYQYPGFTTYFRSVLLGKESLFYSFKGALGYNFFATSVYYLLNPTNIFVLFFKRSNLVEYYTFIIFLRIALCGFTMCKYLKYKFKDKNNIYMIMFSVAYAVCAYNICYMFNYMYFDTVVFFPILMIGLEKLIHENDIKLYIIMLTISILSNFYIGYMVCIFSLLYFIYNYILLEKEKRNKKIVINFILSSLLAGLMCAITLLPVVYDLLQGKADLYSDPGQTDYWSFNLNFINILYKSTPGSMISFDIKYGSVNIYFSLLAMVLVIKYFFNTAFSKKEKIVTGAFIAFFLLSISFNLIDFSWHMFQRPIWYPNRYIFTFVFFLLMIAYKSMKYSDTLKMNLFTKLIICIFYVIIMIYPAFLAYPDYPIKFLRVICFALSIMMLFQYMLFSENKTAKFLIISLFIIEVTLNTISTLTEFSGSQTYVGFKGEDRVYTNLSNEMKKDAKDTKFYRAEWTSTLDYNSGGSYGYNGIKYFNSLRNRRTISFFDNMFDYNVQDASNIGFHYFNPYLNSILGVKYITGAKESYYKLIYDDSISLYKNNEALSLGFMANEKATTQKLRLDGDTHREENNQLLVSSLLGKDINTFEKLPYTLHNARIGKNMETYEVEFKGDDSYVLLEGKFEKNGFLTNTYKAKFYTTIECTVNNTECTDKLMNGNTSLFVHKGDSYKIKISYPRTTPAIYIDYYLLDYDIYNEFIGEMKENELNITSYENDANIEGTITSTKDKNVMFTTIPYDEGWNLYVDGKKTKYEACYDVFLCTKLDEGTHTIKLKYIPPYFLIGMTISLVSLIGSVLFVITNKKNKKLVK